jgi:L-ascorbate metabolism protein UlaG (beta-lactamase superfamily)
MKITWLGHSAFRLDMTGASVLIDPFLTGNPACRTSVEEASRGVTHVALTHGHDDHIGDTAAICKATGATLIAVWEIVAHLGGQGVEKAEPTNTGGTIRAGAFDVTFVRADHSSSSGGVYLGNPCGLIVRETATGKTVYHMGDTDVFGDMALINELYRPKVGIVPIGDRFTMSPKTAALACQRFFNFDVILPCHYATFGLLEPSADPFVKALGKDGGKVKAIDPGQSIEV